MPTTRVLMAALLMAAMLIAAPGANATPENHAAGAAKKMKRAPKIVKAQMRDSDGNMYADRIVLTYNRKVRHKVDTDGTYPFSVGDDYTILRVGKAKGKKMVITLQEKALPELPDSLAAPTVSYKRTNSKPVMSAKKFTKQTAKCRRLRERDKAEFRRRCRVRVQAKAQHVRSQPYGGFFLEVERMGEGTVVSVPPGIDCGDTCLAVFPANLPVVLETLFPGGALEPAWGGDCAGATGPACQLTMDSNKTVTVAFEEGGGGGDFTLSVDVTGPGTVESLPPGISCAPTCEGTFAPNTPVVLTAVPEIPALFDGWTGDCATFTLVPVCTLVMDSDKTVGASFSSLP